MVGIRNFSPHLRNSAILRTTKLIAELQTKKVAELRLRTFKIDFRNSALCRLRPVSLHSSPFYSAQDDFKKQPTIFLEPFIFKENKNLP